MPGAEQRATEDDLGQIKGASVFQIVGVKVTRLHYSPQARGRQLHADTRAGGVGVFPFVSPVDETLR